MAGSVMSPRVGLIATDADGYPKLPQVADVIVGGQQLTVPVWTERFPITVGSHSGWEYRDADVGRLAVTVRIAGVTLPDGRDGALAIAWVQALTRDGDNPTYDAVISGPTMAPDVAGQWPVVIGADGSMTVPALEADGSPAALVAKGAWPAGWRLRVVTDDPGDLMRGIPAAPASGPLCIEEEIE